MQRRKTDFIGLFIGIYVAIAVAQMLGKILLLHVTCVLSFVATKGSRVQSTGIKNRVWATLTEFVCLFGLKKQYEGLEIA